MGILPSLDLSGIETPAFVFDLRLLQARLECWQALRGPRSRVLYSIKALPLVTLLETLVPGLDGLSVSSLFEARLARETLPSGPIHLTTPGLRRQEMGELGTLCDYLSFNTLSQYHRLSPLVTGNTRLGIRINPRLSHIPDPRCDPCRPQSHLGEPWEALKRFWRERPKPLQGLHLHSAYQSTSLAPLAHTLEHLERQIPEILESICWLNLGGGYRLGNEESVRMLASLIERFSHRWDLDIHLEPGRDLVQEAGFLVTTVIDRFLRDGVEVAVVDTSVNHHPEIFEYGHPPVLLNEDADGRNEVELAGSTCVSGDRFGRYRFASRPEVGEHLIFKDVGAYSLVKAQRFNGYNLPAVYGIDQQGRCHQILRFDYQDYRRLWRQS